MATLREQSFQLAHARARALVDELHKEGAGSHLPYACLTS